jgi:microcystin-dependent protein
MFGGNFAPAGWALCEGQLMAIAENDTLFQLIGTTYGGDGQTTFALPELRGRLPVHVGTGYLLGQASGVETVTLTASQIPVHNHLPQARSAGGTNVSPAGNAWAGWPGSQYSTDVANPVAMDAGALLAAGGSQPHTNFAPYLCVNFILSLFGVFPSQT